MGLVVQKYGGTSVGSIERIKNVARRVVATKKRGDQVVVVLSAMSGETDRLISLANEIDPEHNQREYDVLVSSGEQVSISLLAMAIETLGEKAISYLGSQITIRTDNDHSRARIMDIDGSRIRNSLDKDSIVVVAGFQGVDAHGNITTLGRGGSDTSAVAVATALSADVCEIYTDVDGIYTTDPNICNQARKLDRISYDEMLEIEQRAMKLCRGSVLDVGCGSGSHALFLQNRGHEVKAIDIYSGAIETCKLREVKNTSICNIWDIKIEKYETILALMN
jgi:aspartate kinase